MADAGSGALLREQAGSVVHVERASLAGELGNEQVLVAVVVEVAEVHSHVRLGFSGFTERHAPQRRQVPERAIALVDPELVLLLIVRDEDVDPSVPVHVGSRHPERRAERARHARGCRHVSERAVSAIPIEPAGLGAVHLGHAVVLRACRVKTGQVHVECVVQVVADEQVEPSVAIGVDERRRDAPGGIVRAAGGRDLDERAVTLVPKHLVGAEAREVQVNPPVVVDVPGGDAHPVAPRNNSAFVGDVREGQRGPPRRIHRQIVAEQSIPGCRIRPRRERRVAAERVSLDEIDVEIAVVVVVQQRSAGTHDLRLIEAARHPVEVNEVEASDRGDVLEPLHRGVRTRRGHVPPRLRI